MIAQVRPTQILVLSIPIAFLAGYPNAQIAVLVAIHSLTLAALCYIRPHKEQALFAVALFVEAIRLLGVCLLFAIATEPNAFVEAGMLVLNIGTIILLVGAELFLSLRGLWRRFRAWQAVAKRGDEAMAGRDMEEGPTSPLGGAVQNSTLSPWTSVGADKNVEMVVSKSKHRGTVNFLLDPPTPANAKGVGGKGFSGAAQTATEFNVVLPAGSKMGMGLTHNDQLGCEVASVQEGGAAAKTGMIRPHDWIVAVNGRNVSRNTNKDAISTIQAALRTGKAVTMRFRRNDMAGNQLDDEEEQEEQEEQDEQEERDVEGGRLNTRSSLANMCLSPMADVNVGGIGGAGAATPRSPLGDVGAFLHDVFEEEAGSSCVLQRPAPEASASTAMAVPPSAAVRRRRRSSAGAFLHDVLTEETVSRVGSEASESAVVVVPNAGGRRGSTEL